jgi:DNA-binding PadR family transcriptional regulator
MSDSSDNSRSMLDQPERPSSLSGLIEASANFRSEPGDSHACIEDELIGTVSLNDRLVKAYLDEVLVVLISARGGACGQDLIQDLYRLGCGLSPGTIYPHLHDLADEGVLDMHEQRRTKQFEVADHDEVTELVRDAFEDLQSLSSVLLFCGSGGDAEEREEDA